MGALSLKWDITGRCNLKCKHCLVDMFGAGRRHQEITHDERLEIVDKLPPSVVQHINILGGEPTVLRDDFLELVKKCASKAIKTTFNTNGILLDRGFTEKVIEAGAAGIIFSVDGPGSEYHDAVRGQGTFEKTVYNLCQLTDYVHSNNIPFEVTVNTVVNAHNADVIGRMVDLCVDCGVDSLNLLPIDYAGYAADHIKELYLSDLDEIKTAERFVKYVCQRPGKASGLNLDCRFILPPLADYLERKYGYALPLTRNCCGATTTFGYIDPYGNLYPCDRVAFDFSDASFGEPGSRKTSLTDYEFYEVWNSGFVTGMFQFISNRDVYSKYIPCDHCDYLDAGFCVPCPLYALNEKEVVFQQCLFAERELGRLRLSERYSEARMNGSHYLNQYQPRKREVHVEQLDGLSPGSCFRKAEGIRWSMRDDHEVLFNPFSSKFYSVNPLGRRIWTLIDGTSTIEDLTRRLEQEMVDPPRPETIDRDVRQFIGALLSEGLVIAI
ncbi:MAG: PqqD family peptide modification chaperone [Bacillota bacterium]|nr:PqqD family peptide modification chaperone [Bacillota bacterium]